MKKLLASVLCLTMIMSLAACNSKKPEQTTAAVSGTTAATSAPASTEPSASAETTVQTNPAMEFIKDRVEKFVVPGETDEDGEKEEDETLVFHIPELQIKGSYAESINKEATKAFDTYKKNINNEDADEMFFGSSYIAYLSKEGILSLVVISHGEYDDNEYKVYNIDTKTGEKVDNARIAQAAGVSDIRKAAMDALQNLYNKMEIFKIKNYKIVLKKGEKKDAQMKDVEKTFSEKNLNDKMQIGLTNEGKMFFISTIDTTAGAEFYNWVYDVNGTSLDDEDNPCWVGEHFPDDEDDEDEGEEDDAFPPLEDDDED